MIHISLGTGERNSLRQEKLLAPIVGKLNALLGKRYGCSIQIKHQRDTQANHIYVPLDQRQRSFAEIVPSFELTHEQKSDIFQIVNLVLQSSLRSAVRIDHLDRLERHMHSMIKSNNNVLNIEDFRRRKNSLSATIKAQPRSLIEVKGVIQPCLIQAQSETDILKMALEIHERSHRYAFIHLDSIHEIDEGLDQVGSVTLFVPNIAEMNIADQIKTYRYLETIRNKQDPLFVIGALKSPQDLVEERLLLNCLHERLVESFIRLEKPLKDYDLDGLIKMISHKTNLIKK